MFSWLPYSFVRVAIFFIAGILVGVYWPECISLQAATLLFITGLLLFAGIAYARFAGKLSFINSGPFALAAVFLAGYIHLWYATENKWPQHFSYTNETVQYYRVVINDHPVEKQNSWRVEGRITAVQYVAKDWSDNTGKVILYFPKKNFPVPVIYGDVLLVKGSLQQLTEPANPGEFNYKQFLSFNNTHHQHFIRNGEVTFLANNPPNILYHYSLKARIWANETLLRYVEGDNERAVVSALVLGIKDGLDNELMNAYSATGALHVLAVSGLHVGIVYGVLLLLLKPLNRWRFGKWVIALIGVFVLWMYAFITGLSPSVLRAVTMFSFVALARPLQQHTNIYNTLSASAFCMLLWDPYLIMSVGFQLSFLAVLGIVYIQPKIYYLWNPRSLLLHKVWEISCVSIAAQVSTFLLGLLYFHQFPVYFLLSNLFVIPGSTFVLIAGIVALAVSFIQPLALLFGFILKWSVWLLNLSVFQVEKLPFSLIENIYISTPQCWFLMIALLAVFYMVDYRNSGIVVVIASCILLFVGVQWKRHTADVAKNQFVVYKVAGHSAFDFIGSGRAYFYTDSILLKNEDRIRFHIRPNRLQSGVHHIQENDNKLVAGLTGFRLLQWKELTVLHVYDKKAILPKSVSVDYLIVSNNALADIDLISGVRTKKVVLDSSNSFYFANQIIKQSSNMGLAVHSVLHQGAFRVVF
jgi:competence protein ComEC